MPSIGLQHDVFDVGDALEVAAAAHHELELGQLDGAPADIHVAGADRIADLRQSEMPCARKRFGSTTTLYCLTKPPTLATSATPSAFETP